MTVSITFSCLDYSVGRYWFLLLTLTLKKPLGILLHTTAYLSNGVSNRRMHTHVLCLQTTCYDGFICQEAKLQYHTKK